MGAEYSEVILVRGFVPTTVGVAIVGGSVSPTQRYQKPLILTSLPLFSIGSNSYPRYGIQTRSFGFNIIHEGADRTAPQHRDAFTGIQYWCLSSILDRQQKSSSSPAETRSFRKGKRWRVKIRIRNFEDGPLLLHRHDLESGVSIAPDDRAERCGDHLQNLLRRRSALKRSGHQLPLQGRRDSDLHIVLL